MSIVALCHHTEKFPSDRQTDSRVRDTRLIGREGAHPGGLITVAGSRQSDLSTNVD